MEADPARTPLDDRLAEIEERWRLVVEAIGDGVWDWDPRTNRVYYSPGWKQMLGFEDHEVGDSLEEWSSRVHPDDLPASLDALRRHLAGETASYVSEHRLRRRDGTYAYVLDRGKVVRRDADGVPARVVGTHTDLSARHESELEIGRLNRLYAALSGINQAIVRSGSREALLRDVTDVMVRHAGFDMAWIGWRHPDHRVRVVARAGDDAGYLDAVEVFDDDRPEGCGPLGRALREGRPCVCNDWVNDPSTLPWRAAAARSTWRACASFPIRCGTGVGGGLVVYAREPNVFGPRELALLNDVVHDVSFALDVLEREAQRERSEDERRDALLRLEAAVRAGQVGLWDWDLRTDRVTFSREWKALIGYAEHEIGDGLSEWETRVHPDDLERMKSEVARFIAEPSAEYSPVFRFRHRDGSYRFILTQAGLHRDENGVPVRMLGSHIDVTAARASEEALRRSEANLAAAQRLARLGSWELDVASGATWWSDETFRQHGVSKEAGVPGFEDFLALLHPDDRAPVRVLQQACTERGEQGEILYRTDPSRGAVRYILGNLAVSERAPDGAVVRVSGTTLDVTERTLAAEEQRRLEEQLLHAQKLESVGRLAGGVAHDFNNMLGVIIGYADMALEGMPATDPSRPLLQEILKAAHRSAELTNQLLAFARKRPVAPRVIDLNEAVGGMLSMVQRLIGEHIALTWTPGASLWPVLIDRSQFDQIFANLLVNAREAIGPSGAVRIGTANVVVTAPATADAASHSPGDYVELSVADSGVGMDAAVKARIFDPFFTTKPTGTGLGLATVYGAVMQAGGFIEVDSEPGAGSTFRIFLPRHSGDSAGDESAGPEVAPRGSEVVLVAEDEPSLLRLVQSILGGLGYTVLPAADAEEALRRAATHPGAIDLLVTDVVMPRLDGRELARQVAALRPGLRTLFMSGYTPDAHAALASDETHLLRKPFTARALADKVREVLRGAR